MLTDINVEMRPEPMDPNSLINIEVPEVLDYAEPDKKEASYNYTKKTIKLTKPIVYNDKKTLKFTVYANGFVDPDSFVLSLEVVNTNANNYLQLDGTPHSLIKNLTFVFNGQEIERISDYDIITNLMNDMHYKENKYNKNAPIKSPLTAGTQETIIRTLFFNCISPSVPRVALDFQSPAN